MKVPVKHYTEITDTVQLNGIAVIEGERYITNENGKTYLVEVWA